MKISVFVIWHIKSHAKKNKICLPSEFEDILEDAISTYKYSAKKIVFSWFMDGGRKVPNASATIPGIIVINAEWATRLVLYPNDEKMKAAFQLTMGHEFTHQENDYFFLEPFTKEEKFVYWVNEVHADFGGIVKVFEGSVEKGLRAMEYKKRYKNHKDKDSFTHPSWERRMNFIKEYDFNVNLIREIAGIVGCRNEKLIRRVEKHFDEIILC